MIEKLRALSGDEVIRVGGRLMASRIDPRAEARAWVERRARLLDEVRSVIVLGLGCGYHVAELAKNTRARIVVVEVNDDLITSVGPFAGDQIEVVHVTSAASLRISGEIQSAVETSYLVLTHAPSRALGPDIYDEMHSTLLARDPNHLAWAWPSTRLGSLPAFDLEATAPLTIHDLARFELNPDAEAREHLLIKALRELVK